jgi:amino acid transporter
VDENGRRETDKERLDRNLNELLGELRVVMPGVQVLFAFLLAVPFNQRFGQVTGFERGVYFVTLLSTGIAAIFLMAPGALHRMEFRADDKKWIVFRSNRLALTGFAFLALAMTSAVLLVTHFLYSDALAWITTLAIGTFAIALWYLVPYARLRQVRRADDELAMAKGASPPPRSAHTSR